MDRRQFFKEMYVKGCKGYKDVSSKLCLRYPILNRVSDSIKESIYRLFLERTEIEVTVTPRWMSLNLVEIRTPYSLPSYVANYIRQKLTIATIMNRKPISTKLELIVDGNSFLLKSIKHNKILKHWKMSS